MFVPINVDPGDQFGSVQPPETNPPCSWYTHTEPVSVVDPDPDWEYGSGLGIRIRIQEGQNDLQK